MPTVTLAQASSFVVLDTAATPSTGVMRDSSGNILAAQIAGTEIKSTGTLVIARVGKTATFTADTTASYFACDATAGAIVANLPPAATCAGRVYTVKKLDAANNVTLTPNGAETIDGASTVVLSSQWARATVVSNGSNWERVD